MHALDPPFSLLPPPILIQAPPTLPPASPPPHTPPNPPLPQPSPNIRTQHLTPKPLHLQQFQHPKRRPRIHQKPRILWLRPVEQVVEVGDDGWVLEVFLGGEVGEVGGVGEGLHEGELELEAGGGGF